jgi:hypothetical protein
MLKRMSGIPQPAEAIAIPEVLFDGYAVYRELDAGGRLNIAPAAVASVLDAAVRLIRRPPESHAPFRPKLPTHKCAACSDLLCDGSGIYEGRKCDGIPF